MWCGPTTALSESCSVNFGFFVDIVDIQGALGIVIVGYCVMGGCLRCF